MNGTSQRALVPLNTPFSLVKEMVQLSHVSSEELRKGLAESRNSGRPLPQVIKELTGEALPGELVRRYRRQKLFGLKIFYGVESLDLELNGIDHDLSTTLIDSLIPLSMCRRHQVFPLDQDGDEISIAMVDPDDLVAQDELNQVLESRGLILRRLVIAPEDYQTLINPFLDAAVQKEAESRAESHAESRTESRTDKPDAKEPKRKKQKREYKKLTEADLEIWGVGDLDLEEDHEEDDSEDLSDAISAAGTTPIIQTVNKILVRALKEGASDIHVEPQEEFLRIRFRKDGVLQEQAQLPNRVVPAVTSRLKILANLDITERRSPQDGRIRIRHEGRKVDFRVSTLPSRYGEKVVLRILDNAATELGLDKLITDPSTLEVVRDMAAHPFGLILVTGPTGSGKSTTLYSMLAERNDPEVNISTAEDPIEYALDGITQVEVIREKGVDFAKILRSFLRQDPDVILVGETRDGETAKTAIEAALTGHLVLTTLHTNDAAGAIARLDAMGVEPFMVSGALLGVLAQRLMRRVCTECRIPYTPDAAELARFGLSSSQGSQVTFYKANRLTPEEASVETDLCQNCGGSGYKGRVGVYEVMRITEQLQELITEGATTELIKEKAVEEGMNTLLAYSLDLVLQGYTTLEEVERVTLTDSGLEAQLKAKRKSALVCRTCNAQLQQDWLDCPYCTTPRFQG